MAEVLRREILFSRLRPGTQLRQEDIAGRLGVSATPVREAFRLLEAEGYVQARAHRGVVVAERDYDDMIDAYEIRLALESLAIRRVAKRKDLKVIAELRTVMDSAAKAMRAGDTDAFRHASITFHERLSAAADSALLGQLVDRLATYWFFFPQDPRRMAAANRDHVEVIDKLASGDADGAIAVLREHLEGNTEVLRSIRDGGAAVRKPRRPRAAKRPARRKTRA